MNKRLLIIDDDEELCEELTDILKDEGFEVNVATTGIMGRHLLQEVRYDVVILDLKLPGLSGIEILKRDRQSEFRNKVIVLSGRPFGIDEAFAPIRISDEEEAIIQTADAVINKPADVRILLQTIKDLTGRGERI